MVLLIYDRNVEAYFRGGLYPRGLIIKEKKTGSKRAIAAHID